MKENVTLSVHSSMKIYNHTSKNSDILFPCIYVSVFPGTLQRCIQTHSSLLCDRGHYLETSAGKAHLRCIISQSLVIFD